MAIFTLQYAPLWLRRFRWLVLLALMLGLDTIVVWRWCQVRREQSQDRVILRAASYYHVDPALIKAVVWRESQFNPLARGSSGEIGLMQIGKAAAREWARAEKVPLFEHAHLFDPQENVLAGTWYLGKLLKRYTGTDNPLPYALADYNAGRSNVLRWAEGRAATNSAAFVRQIGFPTTQAYVESVLKRYAHYKPIFPKHGKG